MIRRSFIILPSIGHGLEHRFWSQGLMNWSDFTATERVKGIGLARKGLLDRRLEEAERYLEQGTSGYFLYLLPSTEQWRLFDHFRAGAAYLDIETDGLGAGARVTVLSVHRNGETTTMIRGKDLNAESVSASLQDVSLLVTYNGSSFDLPMLQKEFPFALPRVPHFDLRHGCAKVGLLGGLKSVERQLGVQRPREVEYVTGEEAVYLWRLWERHGKENALKLLVRYNMEDTQNLVAVADQVYHRLRDRMEREVEHACSGLG